MLQYFDEYLFFSHFAFYDSNEKVVEFEQQRVSTTLNFMLNNETPFLTL